MEKVRTPTTPDPRVQTPFASQITSASGQSSSDRPQADDGNFPRRGPLSSVVVRGKRLHHAEQFQSVQQARKQNDLPLGPHSRRRRASHRPSVALPAIAATAAALLPRPCGPFGHRQFRPASGYGRTPGKASRHTAPCSSRVILAVVSSIPWKSSRATMVQKGISGASTRSATRSP